MFAIEISYVYKRKMIEMNSRHPGVFGPSLINSPCECTLRNNKHIFSRFLLASWRLFSLLKCKLRGSAKILFMLKRKKTTKKSNQV